MKKRLITFCFCACTLLGLRAQSNIVASGGDAFGPGGLIAYSYGQIDFTTKTEAAGVMTEGVQQPFEITITSATYENWIELNAAVFPNPTANFVELRILGDYQSLNYELIDIGGKVITKSNIKNDAEKIDMQMLPSGVYFLKVNNTNKMVKTFRLIKVN